MANSLYNTLNKANNAFPGNGQVNYINNILTQYNAFKSGFKGDAKQAVQSLLNTGAMTQEQFNQLQQMASSLKHILK